MSMALTFLLLLLLLNLYLGEFVHSTFTTHLIWSLSIIFFPCVLSSKLAYLLLISRTRRIKPYSCKASKKLMLVFWSLCGYNVQAMPLFGQHLHNDISFRYFPRFFYSLLFYFQMKNVVGQNQKIPTKQRNSPRTKKKRMNERKKERSTNQKREKSERITTKNKNTWAKMHANISDT